MFKIGESIIRLFIDIDKYKYAEFEGILIYKIINNSTIKITIYNKKKEIVNKTMSLNFSLIK